MEPLKRHRTTGCHVFGHQELYFDAAARLPERVTTFLAKSLEEHVEGGARLEPGEFARLGWYRLKIAAGEQDDLTLLEPHWTGQRLEWLPHVSKALAAWQMQRWVLDSLGIPWERAYEPPPRTHLYTCGLAGATEKHLLYHCKDEDGGASFWQYMCRDADHGCTDNAPVALPFEPFAFQYPHLVHFLALPAGLSVDLDRDGLWERISDGDGSLAVLPGSYLEQAEQERRQQRMPR
jgi:hypothetical protein